ncbi:hypothetical protein HDV00_000176 [Rhizophlyctis rosea]|nr:hypothetical protein HDV00_000176 [Rhizophlyctis rosea]
MSVFGKLPPDCDSTLFADLSARDLVTLATASKAFHRGVLQDESFDRTVWKLLVARDFFFGRASNLPFKLPSARFDWWREVYAAHRRLWRGQWVLHAGNVEPSYFGRVKDGPPSLQKHAIWSWLPVKSDVHDKRKEGLETDNTDGSEGGRPDLENETSDAESAVEESELSETDSVASVESEISEGELQDLMESSPLDEEDTKSSKDIIPESEPIPRIRLHSAVLSKVDYRALIGGVLSREEKFLVNSILPMFAAPPEDSESETAFHLFCCDGSPLYQIPMSSSDLDSIDMKASVFRSDVLILSSRDSFQIHYNISPTVQAVPPTDLPIPHFITLDLLSDIHTHSTFFQTHEGLPLEDINLLTSPYFRIDETNTIITVACSFELDFSSIELDMEYEKDYLWVGSIMYKLDREAGAVEVLAVHDLNRVADYLTWWQIPTGRVLGREDLAELDEKCPAWATSVKGHNLTDVEILDAQVHGRLLLVLLEGFGHHDDCFFPNFSVQQTVLFAVNLDSGEALWAAAFETLVEGLQDRPRRIGGPALDGSMMYIGNMDEAAILDFSNQPPETVVRGGLWYSGKSDGTVCDDQGNEGIGKGGMYLFWMEQCRVRREERQVYANVYKYVNVDGAESAGWR